MRRRLSTVALLFVVLASGCASQAQSKQRLDEVYMPAVAHVPPPAPVGETLTTLAKDWRDGGRTTLTGDLLSTQGLLVLVAFAVLLLVGWDFRRSTASRNVELALLFAAGLAFFDVMRFFGVLRNPVYLRLLDWIFVIVVGVGLALIVRAIQRVRQPATVRWAPRLSAGPLALLAIVLLCSNLWIAVARPPDDAGWFVNLGAQRLRERGRLPYGDPLLTATPGAAYGPLLYAAHVPFQMLLAPRPVNEVSPARPDLRSGPPYYLPPIRATQLAAAAFHLAGVAALFLAARRMANVTVALALVCLYCGSLAVLGIGGRDDQVAGLTFISHIAPAAMTLATFAALQRPALAGVLLAMSTGIGFYPAFMAPAWLGYYWTDRVRRASFIAGFAVAATVIAVGVYALSRPAGDRTRLGTIMWDTFGHHTDPAGYGSSPFGFWGQREGLRRVLNTPLVGTSGLTSPAWLAFAGFLSWTFFLARGRRPAELAMLMGAVAVGATLIKPHATGTYLAWFYPLLLLGFLLHGFTSEPQKV